MAKACCIGVLAAVAAVWAGCSHEAVSADIGASKITPVVKVDASVTGPDGSTLDGYQLGFAPQPSDFRLTISSSGGEYEGEWASVNDYPENQTLRPGAYWVTATYGDIEAEGFGKPCFGATVDAILEGGRTTVIDLSATLLNAAVTVNYTDEFTTALPGATLTFHSEGGEYLSYSRTDEGLLFLRTGKVNVILDGIEYGGKTFSCALTDIDALSPQSICRATLDVEREQPLTIKLSVANGGTPVEAELAIDETLADSSAPTIACEGFEPDETIPNVEGTFTGRELALNVSGARELIMTTSASFIAGAIGSDWPYEVDLLSLSPAYSDLLDEGGVTLTRDASGTVTVNLTRLASKLGVATPHARFDFLARNAKGLVSDPVSLTIDVLPANIEVLSLSEAVIGVNTANLLLSSDSDNLEENLRIFASDDGTEWYEGEIRSIVRQADSDKYDVTFYIPTQSSNDVKLQIVYCNHTVGNATLQVVAPAYTIDVDAFALSAKIKINADDADMQRLITSIARVYADGRRCHVVERDIDNGIIIVGDLEASTTYTFTSTVADDYTESDLTPAVKVTTEATAGLANSDFEDVTYHALKYKNMPSGGRYSQTIVEIYNQQNYTSFDLSVPKKWATTNDKTFCLQATNINTWYVEPSVYTVEDCAGGSYAVKLQSAAWDVTGPGIPNWRQPSQPYVNYSRAIPRIAHRAAAKLFIGSYSFDAANLDERYNVGTDFASRPSALNGYFKYVPSPSNTSDRGLVEVEILGEINGKQTVIASGSQLLGAALDYTTFSVPLTYNLFKVKATGIRVMISSSEYTGSIEYESTHVSTWDDPEHSRSLGSALWVDELTLSY